MTSSSPTWYDVLGVAPDADSDEIKAAWRNATDKFEPGQGSGQFRMFNEAADVLLDPASRAAYDASLATGGPVAQPPVAQPPVAQPPVAPSSPVEDAPPAPSGPSTGVDPKAERRRAREERRALAAEKAAAKKAAMPDSVRRPASRTALMLTALLAVLTVTAVICAVVFGLRVRDDNRATDARAAAPAAAERAAKEVLAYDYKTLPADRKRAASYLTPGFEKTYLKNFALLEKQKDGTPGAAVQSKTVVTASVAGSAVVAADEDKVRVLVYVNQVSKKPGKDPQIFQNRVAMTMQKQGDKWLVADLKSY